MNRINLVNNFVAETIEKTFDSKDFITTKTLYQTFKDWCRKNQLRNLTIITFVNEMKKIDGLEKTRRRYPGTWRKTSASHGFEYCKLKGSV